MCMCVLVCVRLFTFNMCLNESLCKCAGGESARCSWFDCVLCDSYLSVDMTKSLILSVYVKMGGLRNECPGQEGLM